MSVAHVNHLKEGGEGDGGERKGEVRKRERECEGRRDGRRAGGREGDDRSWPEEEIPSRPRAHPPLAPTANMPPP